MRFFKTLLFEKTSRIAEFLGHKNHIAIRYFLKFGKRINWKQPEDLNQLICKEMVYGNHPEWTIYADKIRVHEYIKSIGLGHILRPIITQYKTAGDIDFSELPDKCVLKTTNGFYDKIFYDRKKDCDEKRIRKHFAKLEKRKFGKRTGELHYVSIPYMIFAEPLIDISLQDFSSSSAADYKMWFIDGQYRGTHIIFDRNGDNKKHQWRDINWKMKNDYLIETPHNFISDIEIPKPAKLDEMINYGKKITQGQKVLRVDFYVIENRPFLGEITCTSYCGLIDQYSDKALKELISS